MNTVRPSLREAWKLLGVEPAKFGILIGLYLWVAGAPFGLLHPDNDNWLFFYRLLPFWRLFALVGLSIVGVAAGLLAFLFLYRRGGDRPLEEARRSFRRVASPIYFLPIGLVQLVPGAMSALPILPLVNKLILPVAVFSSTLFLFVIETSLLPAGLFRSLDRSLSAHTWRWSAAVFLVSLMAYGIFTKRCDMAFGYTGGDEAHYLTQAQSLAEDFDRDLVNQLPDHSRNGMYYLAKHLSAKSPPGKAYSYHSIGLPLLLAPGWAVARMKGAVGVVVAISSLFAVTFFWIAFRLRGRSKFAIGAWAVFCFTTPIIFYACRAYPELPSGLLILFVTWRFMKPELLTAWGWLAMGCLVAFLPWLHIPRLAIPTVLLSVWGIGWLLVRGKKKNLTFFVPPLFLSVVLLIVLNQHWYGYSWRQAPGATGFEKLDPGAWTGGYYHQPKELFSCWPGLLGEIMDRFKGLLVSSPVYLVPLLCLFLGLFAKKRKVWRQPWLWVFLVVYIPALSRRGWYGGACFPSRFLISVLPLLLFPLAGVLSDRRDKMVRAFFAVLAAFSAWITLQMLFNTGHFYRGTETARWLSPAAQLIALFFPYAGTFRPVSRLEDPFGILLFVLWIAGVICLLQWARRREIPWHRSLHLTIAAILVLPLLTTGIRRVLGRQPYQFSFSGALEHFSTVAGINQPSSANLHVVEWGKIAPGTVAKELTLELPAVEQKTATGEVAKEGLLNREVVAYEPGKHQPGYLSYTHPLNLFSGAYLGRFYLAVEGWNPENSIVLDVQDMATGDVIASRRVSSADLSDARQFTPVPVPFSLERYLRVSLRVYVDAKSPVQVLEYSLEPLCLPEILAGMKHPAGNRTYLEEGRLLSRAAPFRVK
jgi:hypothetical protein